MTKQENHSGKFFFDYNKEKKFKKYQIYYKEGIGKINFCSAMWDAHWEQYA